MEENGPDSKSGKKELQKVGNGLIVKSKKQKQKEKSSN